MDKIEQAVELFDKGFNCAQAIVVTYGPYYGLDGETGARVATGFGGGMGCMGNICGALTGVYMVIGLEFGQVDAADKRSKFATYELVARAEELFRMRNGCVECRNLLGFDMSTPIGKLASKKPGAFDKCSGFVRDAAEILEEILGEDSQSENN